ncbi:MAG: PHP domain-containing protein, partial [Ignavibacteriaceae bacterium]|nr:PHP domain-containing protein [Ignavibacteriaceae bacterium]
MKNLEIINPGNEDFHIHSLNYSDGMNTIDEIVKFSGEIGLTKIAITDHCQEHLTKRNLIKKNHYNIIDRWKNVYNEVDVKFGVEADLLNEDGDVCMEIQGITSEIILLSSHPAPIYSGNPTSITEGYLNAIERFHKNISFLAHPCSIYFEDYIDIIAITELCNNYEIPMELNCANLVNKRTNLKNLQRML